MGVLGDVAVVATQPTSMCVGCAMRQACADSLVAPDTCRTIELPNTVGARVGDTVVLDLEPRGLLSISFLLYLFPALSAVGGAALGAAVGPDLLGTSPDGGAVLFLALLVAASFGVIRLVQGRLAERPQFQVKIERVVPGPSVEPSLSNNDARDPTSW